MQYALLVDSIEDLDAVRFYCPGCKKDLGSYSDDESWYDIHSDLVKHVAKCQGQLTAGFGAMLEGSGGQAGCHSSEIPGSQPPPP